ncbi:hypothetical protein D9758_002095 [Tetrapyrgos nigripes]|uniref:DNA repair and recombination protein RAD54B n=1 Tax=Tetrapyrgos nigripes TaxID=182062 RepID=A0A8H5GT19_9AGAR|nr:hypothetical protein D9758_002095 [Tetrapyrgos nigripes]
MPAFQPLTLKRKHVSEDSSSTKRINLDMSTAPTGGDHYWMVQWRNPQTKKHTTWEGDAVLVALNDGAKSILCDSDGKQMTSGKLEPKGIFEEGKEAMLGGKHIQFDREISKDEYLSGICFGSSSFTEPALPVKNDSTFRKAFSAPRMNSPLLRPPQPTSSNKPSPLRPINVAQTPEPKQNISEVTGETDRNSYWAANWRKPAGNKKQAPWEGDAFVSKNGNKMTIISEEGKTMGSTTWKGGIIENGLTILAGSKEILLLNEISQQQLPLSVQKTLGLEIVLTEEEQQSSSTISNVPASRYVPPVSMHSNISFAPKKTAAPLHDPAAEGAVVMKAPTKEHIDRHNKKNRAVVPVVLDPILARRMRPHQIEGVKFMYESVMGLRKHEGFGCILADEMGLGKTLQTIALVWTLLKQNPYHGVGPVASKVLVVCPVSLINNWRAEFHKWLGRDRLGVSICDKDMNVVKVFANSPRQNVLIVGYERLRTIVNHINTCGIGLIVCDEGHRLKSSKSKTNKVFQELRTPRRIILSGTPIQNDLGEFHAMVEFCNPGLLDGYGAFRRVYEAPILKSRAPGCTSEELELGEKRSTQLANVAKSFVLRREATILGNFLPPKHEYVVFVTPTTLQLSIFAKILQPDHVDDLVQGSTAESLALITLLTKVSSSPILLKATIDKERAKGNSAASKHRNLYDAAALLPPDAQIDDMGLSGKFCALAKLLNAIKEDTDEKCVLVSHYTSTLNILEAFCEKMNYSYYRLDGQTPAAKRQEYVNVFNKTNQKTSFLFLLSSKAGGIGINLIGASRLCLIDSDWNPSHDLQAMARCHRDGQKKPVYIYRFLTAGTIDGTRFDVVSRRLTDILWRENLPEANYQVGLEQLIDGIAGSKADSFTRKDLRDIFRIHPDTACNTHDLLQCVCDNDSANDPETINEELQRGTFSDDEEKENLKGFVAASQVKTENVIKADREYLRKQKESLVALEEWRHINCLKTNASEEVQDPILQKLLYIRQTSIATDESTDQSKLERLLTAVDIDVIEAMDSLNVRDVPGGTISFLLQKSSSTVEADRKEEDDIDHVRIGR